MSLLNGDVKLANGVGNGKIPRSDVFDEELDFHLEFPSPVLEADGQSLTNVGPNGNGTGKDPLVILLGWAGSQDKYLSKYSEIYRKRGCVVLRFITPVKVLFWEARKLPSVAKRLVSLLQEMQLDAHPTFFHIFSNGGGFTYSYLLRELARVESDFKMDIRGTIYDSAPAPRNMSCCFKALCNIMSGFKYGVNYIIAGMIIVLLVMQVLFYHLKSALRFCCFGDNLEALAPDHCKEESPLHNWLNVISRVRNHWHLFIYSDGDELIYADEIEKFAKITESRGNYVQKLKLDGSEHVQHYRKYPKEYVEAVTTFIRRALKEKKEPTYLWKE